MSEINDNNLYTIKTKGFASSLVLNKNFQSISGAHNELEGRVRNIEQGDPPVDAEIQTARGTYGTLNERLNDIGKERRENIVIQGMKVTELTYPSDERVSFTIKTGEVFIQGKTIKVTQNTAFTNIDLDENYRVVVCDTSGVISLLTQETAEFDIPTIGQNKRPLYLFKKEGDHEAIFYDCRHWGVISLMGWHFSLQEAFDDFFNHSLEELHSLGHRHLSLEYVGVANRLETRGASFQGSTLATKLEEWTLHVKGKGGAVFLIEGLRTLVADNPQTLGTIIDGRGFKAITVENISFQLPPWHFNALSKAVITATGPTIKDCEMDFETNRSGTGAKARNLLTGNKNVYFHTNIKISSAYFGADNFHNVIDSDKSAGLCINGYLLSHESVIRENRISQPIPSSSRTPSLSRPSSLFQPPIESTSSRTYILVEYTFSEVNFNTSSTVVLIGSNPDGNRLSITSDLVLVSAIAYGSYVPNDIPRDHYFNNDVTSAGFFHFDTVTRNYQFTPTSNVLRNSKYSQVKLRLTFKVYNWDRFLGDYSPPSS